MAQGNCVCGTYQLVAVSVVASLTCFAAPARGEEAALTTLPPVSGTVVDDRTGEPVPDFAVTYGDSASIPYWQHTDSKRSTGGRFVYAPPEHFSTYGPKPYKLQVRAKGYKTAASRMIGLEERDVKLEFRLVRPEPFAGRARLPDGDPAAGAAVRVLTPGNYLAVSNGAPSQEEVTPPADEKQLVKADEAGRFAVNVECERCRIVVVHDAGFADVAAKTESGETADVTLRQWGAVECSVVLDGKPGAGLKIVAETHDESRRSADDDPRVDFSGFAETGADGRCKLERVPPGKVVVSIHQPRDFRGRDRDFGTPYVRNTPVEVPAGGTATVRLGGGGAEVTGRFTADGRDIQWDFARARLYPSVEKGWQASDWRDEVLVRSGIPVEVRPDGTFRATDVAPGEWRIDGMAFLPISKADGLIKMKHAGTMLDKFSVPQRAGDQAAAGPRPPVIDLGAVPVKFLTVVNAGDTAPEFEVTTLDGKQLRLADLRGKYVLLDFWATWCGPCRAQMPDLKKSWEAVKDDPDVVILGLSLDETDEPVRPYVDKHGYGWTHAVLGEGSQVTRAYGVESIPHVWLVLPDGTLASVTAHGLAEQIARHRKNAADSGDLPSGKPKLEP